MASLKLLSFVFSVLLIRSCTWNIYLSNSIINLNPHFIWFFIQPLILVQIFRFSFFPSWEGGKFLWQHMALIVESLRFLINSIYMDFIKNFLQILTFCSLFWLKRWKSSFKLFTTFETNFRLFELFCWIFGLILYFDWIFSKPIFPLFLVTCREKIPVP